MTARNIRPRVLTAVYELGTFTVSELCRAAGLADRNQAYSQLDRLEERGFLEKKTVPAGARHAPFKQYTLVSDPVKRSEFAQEITAYRPLLPVQAESELGRLAIQEAQQELDRAEKSLAAIEGTTGKEAQTQVAEAGAELASAWTNIETAQLEYDGAANPEMRQVIAGLTERWQSAEEKRKELADKLERHTAVNWALLLRTAARAVNDLASAANPAWGSGEQVAFLSKRLFPARKKEAYRVPIEVLLGEIRADQKYPFVPVFRHALRTGDADVLFEIVRILNKIDLAWWNYNRENTCYLKTDKLRTKDWLRAYKALKGRIPFSPKEPFKVYSCALERLTRDLYLEVTGGPSISLVSSHEIPFLGTSEVIQPTLIVEAGSMLEPLECGFLNPKEPLYAYGPIANDIACWQGAPDLRVAACLGMWGLPLDEQLQKITKPLKSNRGLLVVQGRDPELTPEATMVLDAQEIAECLFRP